MAYNAKIIVLIVMLAALLIFYYQQIYQQIIINSNSNDLLRRLNNVNTISNYSVNYYDQLPSRGPSYTTTKDLKIVDNVPIVYYKRINNPELRCEKSINFIDGKINCSCNQPSRSKQYPSWINTSCSFNESEKSEALEYSFENSTRFVRNLIVNSSNIKSIDEYGDIGDCHFVEFKNSDYLKICFKEDLLSYYIYLRPYSSGVISSWSVSYPDAVCQLGTYGEACKLACLQLRRPVDSCLTGCIDLVRAKGLGNTTTCCKQSNRQYCQAYCENDECVSTCISSTDNTPGIPLDGCHVPLLDH